MGKRYTSYREMLSNVDVIRNMFDGVVQESGCYGPDLPNADDLDWSKAQLLPTSFADSNLQHFEPDCVWRIPYCQGKGPDFLLLITHQPTIHTGMALQVLTSVALLYQDLLSRDLIPPGAYYPQVMPVVIYSGQTPWDVATRLAEKIDSSPEMRHLQPDINYILMDRQEMLRWAFTALGRISVSVFGDDMPPAGPETPPLGDDGAGLRL